MGWPRAPRRVPWPVCPPGPMVRTAPLLLAAALGSCSAGLDGSLPAPALPEPVDDPVPVVLVVAGVPDTLAVRDLLGTEAAARFGRHPDVTVAPVGADSVVVYARPRFSGLAVVPFAVAGAGYALAVQSAVLPEVTVRYTVPARPLQVRPRPDVAVVGAFTGWAPEPLEDPDRDGVYERTLALAPGTYAYRLVVDGEEIPDPEAGAAVTDSAGVASSLLVVAPPPERLHLRLVGPDEADPSVLRLAVHRLGADGRPAFVDIDEEEGVVALVDNRLLNDNAVDADFDDVGLDLDAAGAGPSRLRVAVHTDDGLVSNWVEVPLRDGRPTSG